MKALGSSVNSVYFGEITEPAAVIHRVDDRDDAHLHSNVNDADLDLVLCDRGYQSLRSQPRAFGSKKKDRRL